MPTVSTTENPVDFGFLQLPANLKQVAVRRMRGTAPIDENNNVPSAYPYMVNGIGSGLYFFSYLVSIANGDRTFLFCTRKVSRAHFTQIRRAHPRKPLFSLSNHLRYRIVVKRAPYGGSYRHLKIS